MGKYCSIIISIFSHHLVYTETVSVSGNKLMELVQFMKTKYISGEITLD